MALGLPPGASPRPRCGRPSGGYASRTPKRTALQVARVPGPQPLMRRAGPTHRTPWRLLLLGLLVSLRRMSQMSAFRRGNLDVQSVQ
jgi:hypothetical protein